jgi:Kef-type K+ transport system membrane component KefB
VAESEGLGGRFWLGLVGFAVALGVGLMLAFVLFGAAWYRWGFIGAAILLVGVGVGVKYLQERRARSRWG